MPLAVGVGVQAERRPALRCHVIAGFLEHLAVEPADGARAGDPVARPERLVGVLGKYKVVRWEAGADERELSARRIVHGEMPTGVLLRELLVVRIALALLSGIPICLMEHSCGRPV